ncbi:helix-turn-helix transcriptional regulator [Streptomyces sp. CB01881]|uniref:helix-turn-helix domain-containing protein n=1 Tax=Streptomyces sp. CB01881 TaxID=2078691 RepID=UPI000CDBCA06|nr:helix-turn-helix transcriptional regulator [Streptomyces sp. CB01881]AUY50675.1 transcriptional regulator [Streptomyces sp. CB01881]TYC74061.1 XRE family transcriptional regulator [Streptomyces sp. CB01881]
MPGRQNPTFRQRRLGAEVRRMREQAGLGGSQLARALGVSAAQVTQMESGKTSVSAERLRTIAEACSCTNQSLIDALGSMTQGRTKGWWEEYRSHLPDTFLESAEHEDFAAGTIRVWTSAFLPGLLQTSDYVKGVFGRRIPSLAVDEVDLHAAFRTRRRSALLRSPQKKLEAYLHESCLLTRFGGTEVLLAQLGCLLEDSFRDNISIRVIPFNAHTYPGAIENIIYSFGVVPELDTVEMDTSRGPVFSDAPNELHTYRVIFGRIEKAALTDEESRDLIRSIAQDLKG